MASFTDGASELSGRTDAPLGSDPPDVGVLKGAREVERMKAAGLPVNKLEAAINALTTRRTRRVWGRRSRRASFWRRDEVFGGLSFAR